MSSRATKRFVAEFVGTAVLVVGGVGTAVFATSTAGNTGIALAFGLSLLAMAYAIGPISGCHINPAVTVAMLVSGRTAWRDAVGYIVAQLAGATAGAGILYAIAVGRPGYHLATKGLGANGYGAHSTDGYHLGSVAVAEVMLTFLLVFTVLAATDRIGNAAFAGIPIGLALTVCHLVAIPIDGTSVNPARSFGPALITGGAALSQLWIFLIAPVVGGLVAAGAYRLLFHNSEPLAAPASAVAARPPATV
jgi:aquaporin Z